MIVLVRVPVGPRLPDSMWDQFFDLDEALPMKKAHRELGRYSHYQVRPIPEGSPDARVITNREGGGSGVRGWE